jgi:hypothetical protein
MKDKLFEEWAKTHNYKTKIEEGFYTNTHTQSAWEAWKASAPRELSDEEIDECLYATDWSYDPHSFARAILKKASEK